ncbi:MAG: LeoA/HP0731 family dynamin-like GTPase, partial [Cyanobacteria bacterium J06639_18]
MLFDSITVENFKKLAYEKGYRWKMMLLINKMSDEAGDEAEKIANYRHSLAEALKPYELDEFPVCFIDAKDYCEGVDREDDFLIEISRFETFLHSLNKFVERRSIFARFDTPIRIALANVDEALLIFTRNSNQDSVFLEVLTRLSRKVRKHREHLRTKVHEIALKMSSAITREGIVLANAVGTEQNFEDLNKQSEVNVQKHYEEAERKLQNTVNSAVEDIQEEIADVLNSNLVQTFIACLNKDLNVSTHNIDSSMNVKRLLGQVNILQEIGKEAGVKLASSASREFLPTAGGGFLRSIDVAGSSLHKTVLTAGEFVGFKFRPWEAVGIAKNIGNAAKFLGPALLIVGVAADAYSMHQEKQREQKMAEIRQDITSQFQKLAKDLENQIQLQLWEFEQQVYNQIDKQILEARQQEENAIAASNTWVKQLAEVRQDFESILRYITKATGN